MPKEYIFLQLNENEFEVVKSALEQESFDEGKLLIAQNNLDRMEKKIFSGDEFEEILEFLRNLRVENPSEEQNIYKSSEF